MLLAELDLVKKPDIGGGDTAGHAVGQLAGIAGHHAPDMPLTQRLRRQGGRQISVREQYLDHLEGAWFAVGKSMAGSTRRRHQQQAALQEPHLGDQGQAEPGGHDRGDEGQQNFDQVVAEALRIGGIEQAQHWPC